MEDKAYYVLVNSTNEGWALYNALREQGCACRISPTPRGLQACCGMSILVKPQDLPAVEKALALPGMPSHEGIVELDNQINPNRDVYC